MSWDAHLTDDRGHDEGEWNYTHNTSGMIYAALNDAGIELPASTRPCRWLDRETGTWHDAPEGHGTIAWWEHLDGMPGPEGAAFLDQIIQRLQGNPALFRAMNPPNGWGNYDDLLTVLTAMRDRVPEWPTTWRTFG
jgi:hypothetical protein